MAKRYRFKKRRSSPRRFRFRKARKDKSIPILPLIGGFVAPMIDSAYRSNLVNDPANPSAWKGMIDQISQHYTGFAPFPEMGGGTGFHWDIVAQTYGGLLMGIVGHKLASKFGVNRSIHKIPVIGKYLSL
jgi:hypothetical protein